MGDRRVSVADLATEWLQDPAFRAEYDALEEEFTQAAALIEARGRSAETEESPISPPSPPKRSVSP